MTYPQYKAVVAGINEKINWDLHLSTLAWGGEIQHELNPLYSEQEPEHRVFRMSDAVALKEMADKG